MTRFALFFALGPALVGCDLSSSGPAPSRAETVGGVPSSIVPQPRVLDTATATAYASSDANDAPGTSSPPPSPFESGERLPVDSPPAKGELTGVELEANWSWPSQQTEPNERATPSSPDLRIYLTSLGRARITVATPTTTLAEGTELLGRVDRYGGLVVWPKKSEYRTLPPGMLRALLDDRRVDASPLSKATVTERGEGSRLGMTTRRVELSGAFGVTTLELAKVREAGLGSLVLCRVLVELGGVDPSLAPCRDRGEVEVPVFASYAWASHPEKVSLRLEAVSIARHEKDAQPLAVPSTNMSARSTGVPTGKPILFEDGASEDRDAGAEPASRGEGVAPGAVTAINQADRTMFLVLAGKAVASLGPRTQLRLSRLPASKGRAEWRSFLGDEASAAFDVAPGSRIAYPPEPR